MENAKADAMFLIFLILFQIPDFIHTQEYLTELQSKDIKIDINHKLASVELPRPIFKNRYGRSQNFEQEDELVQSNTRKIKTQRPTLIDIALEASVREGLNAMRQLYGVIEPDMMRKGHILDDNHPAALLSKFSAPVIESSRREMAAFATLTAAKAFRKSYNLNNDLARQANSQKVSLRRTALESLCPPRDPPTCMRASERYRTHDGTCNNKRRSRWGAAQMPFSRFLPPEYGDGVDSARQSADGGTLSSSRFVSLLVHGARDGEAPLTLMLVQWGQLLDHDLTSTAQPRSINGSVPSCCGNTDFHPSCFPIKVPLDDPWLSPLKVRCLEFLRSAPAQRRDCVLSWREQTNQATSFIDASPIYSNSVKSSDNARVFRNGLLIFGRGNPNDDACQRGAIATHCIRSGDGRSSEQPGLLALHHVWVGEHNHIAMRLSEMNLHWSDEKIYQETRKIIGALFQHITYREFLPIVLGREVVKLFDLELLNSGYYEGYDPKTNSGVANAFAAAAFRFGHSLVQNSYKRCDRFHNVLGNNVSLHEEFQRGDIGSVGSLHRLIRGMANQKTLKRDEFITPELTNHLFQTPGFPFGLDLAAINIQRGRDHGIAPYTHWRVPCGLSPINTWEEFANVVGPESARRISHAYHNVHDIDLFVGGIAERPVIGGLVGPTFACIIAQQFTISRKGDRFWYENGRLENSFTPAQLHSIRRVTLASVLCRSVGGGTFQPHIFLPPDLTENERIPCGVGSLAEFDLAPWLEQDPFATPSPLSLQSHIHPSEPPAPSTRPTPAKHAQTFDPPLLDRIFEIVQAELETKSPDISLPDKVGFSNRRPPSTKEPIFTAQNPPEAILHSSHGFHRIKNITKINDKLDLKRKGNIGHITKQKPLPGVSNKLDKHSRKGLHRHGTIQTTTRKTIIVNNIPIALSNVGNDIKAGSTAIKLIEGMESRTEKQGHITNNDDKVVESHASNESTDILKPRTEDSNIAELTETLVGTDMDEVQGYIERAHSNNISAFKSNSFNLTTETNNVGLENAKHLNNDTSFYETGNDNGNSVSPETHTNKLVKIHTQPETSPHIEFHKTTNVSEHTTSTQLRSTDSDIDPMANSPAVEHRRVQRKLINPMSEDLLPDKSKIFAIKSLMKSNTTLTVQNKTLVTKSPKEPKRTTLRNSELRQYQNRPSFTKPPKVIVDADNGDNQYQIEINIRQSNKSPKPSLSTSFEDYTTNYKTKPYDRYTPNYPNFQSTTPIYAYYQPLPTQAPLPLGHNKKTKPPTIIFLNEHGDHASTTRQPGFVHSIVGWSSGGHKPFPMDSNFNERPSALSGSQSGIAVPGAYQNPSPGTVSSFSQAQLGGGVVQATSQAVSNGQYGTIAGFSSAHGADSAFSFNIRPKPDQTLMNRPESVGNYGFTQMPPKTWHTQNHEYGDYMPPYDIPYRENVQSPFSSANSQTYYIPKKTRPQLKEDLTLYRDPLLTDYDYLSRARKPLRNITKLDYKQMGDVEYEYDEDYGNSPLLRKFNQDGYLRPEHMIRTLLAHQGNETKVDRDKSTNSNQTPDDNYVLPAMNSTKSTAILFPKPIFNNFTSNFPDSQSKQLNNGIFAEDLQETEDANDEDPLEKANLKIQQRRIIIMKQKQEKIAFAPITVLTTPERPDNWVIYDSPKEEPALPQIPDLKMDLSPSSEIPKPIRENIWLSLTNVITNTSMGLKSVQSNEIAKTQAIFLSSLKTSNETSKTLTVSGVTEAPSATTEVTTIYMAEVSTTDSGVIQTTDPFTETVTRFSESTGATND